MFGQPGIWIVKNQPNKETWWFNLWFYRNSPPKKSLGSLMRLPDGLMKVIAEIRQAESLEKYLTFPYNADQTSSQETCFWNPTSWDSNISNFALLHRFFGAFSAQSEY